MHKDTSEANVKIVQECSWDDDALIGEAFSVQYNVVLSSPTTVDAVKLTYSGENESVVGKRIVDDIMSYVSDPVGWTERYFRAGEIKQKRLMNLQAQLDDQTHQLEMHRLHVRECQIVLDSIKSRIVDLKIEMGIKPD